MSFYTSQRDHRNHQHHPHSATSGSDSERDSSGGATPTPTVGISASTSSLASSVSSLWGGLIRRFSSDGTGSSWGSALQHASQSNPHYPYHYDGGASNNGIDEVYIPRRLHHPVSPMRLPSLEPLTLTGFRDDTPPDARLLDRTVAEEIRIMVPARLSIVDEWNLVYSLDQDGASLGTLYDKCRRYEGRRVGFALVVKDREGAIFGAYLSDFPHPAPKYYGTGECFLWRASVMSSLPPPPSADTTHLTGRATTIAAHNVNDPAASDEGASNGALTVPASPAIRFTAFPYSGVNEYYILCEAHFLSVGAGDGKYGLWLDDGLAKGISSTCLTFGNERLSDEGEKFGVLGVEVWVIGAPGP